VTRQVSTSPGHDSSAGKCITRHCAHSKRQCRRPAPTRHGNMRTSAAGSRETGLGLAGPPPVPAQGPGQRRDPRSRYGQGRLAGIAAHASDDPDGHRAEHALHTRSHMPGRRPPGPGCPAGTVRSGHDERLGALVMEGSPGNGELLPAADLAAGHIGDRYAISRAPARVNFTIGGNRHAHGRGQRPAQLATPDAGRDQSLQHALQNILTRTPCGRGSFPRRWRAARSRGCAVLRSKCRLAVWVGLGVLARPRRMPGCRDHRQLVALGG